MQRIDNDLEAEGVIAFRANPLHKRAPLIQLTAHGCMLLEQAMNLQRPWAARLGKSLPAARAVDVIEMLDELLVAISQTTAADLNSGRFLDKGWFRIDDQMWSASYLPTPRQPSPIPDEQRGQSALTIQTSTS